MEPTPTLLSVQNLGRSLGGRWLWRGVSFDLAAGDWLGLVGPSGSGKTLLLRALVLLDPWQQGSVTLAGKTPTEWTVPRYRSRVMYLPQRPTVFEGTVQDNLKRVFDLGLYRQHRFDLAKIETWLAQLGRSPDFLNRPGPQLSGGETQVVALLRALQLNPQVLLLDEPTASLDEPTTDLVEELLSQWLSQPGRACLLTSHDREQIRRVTHRQLHLEDWL